MYVFGTDIPTALVFTTFLILQIIIGFEIYLLWRQK